MQSPRVRLCVLEAVRTRCSFRARPDILVREVQFGHQLFLVSPQVPGDLQEVFREAERDLREGADSTREEIQTHPLLQVVHRVHLQDRQPLLRVPVPRSAIRDRLPSSRALAAGSQLLRGVRARNQEGERDPRVQSPTKQQCVHPQQFLCSGVASPVIVREHQGIGAEHPLPFPQ